MVVNLIFNVSIVTLISYSAMILESGLLKLSLQIINQDKHLILASITNKDYLDIIKDKHFISASITHKDYRDIIKS